MRKHKEKTAKKIGIVLLSGLMLSAQAAPVFHPFTIVVEAHQGRTDSSGGHHDYQNKSGLGSYHYHHGMPAHLHPNGVCPYSSSSSASSSSSSSSSSKKTQSQAVKTVVTTELMNSYQAVFDADYYYNVNPDLQAAIGHDNLKLFEHFYTNGMAEGRKGCDSFDVNVYKENNADLKNAYGDNLKAYYEHYLSTGCKEDRVHQ